MFPWYAGRSKPYDYDEDDGYPVDNGFHWWEILFFPFVVIIGTVVVFLFDGFMVLAIIGVCLKQLCQDTLETLKSGKLSHPVLAYAGGLCAIVLFFLSASGFLDPSLPHIPYIILGLGFIFFCTVLPLMALLMYALSLLALKILTRLAQIKPCSCLLALIVFVIGSGLTLAYLDQKGTTLVIFYSP
jgi:hypothetical protein